MGTHVPAENEHGYMINQPRGSMRASRRQGTGERAWKGAPRGDARTIEMRSVPELIRMRRLSIAAAA